MTSQRRSTSITIPPPDTALRAGDGDPAPAAPPDDPVPWEVTLHPGSPSPPEMEGASVEEVMTALDGFRIDGPWEAVADAVVPVLPRRRPMPDGVDPEVRWRWPVGLTSTFGIDLGPALLFITEGLAARWGVDDGTLAHRAIQTMRERLPRSLGRGLLHDATGGLPLRAFQSGDGWASALVLAPELLPDVFGTDPALLLAPMRDLLVALPIDTDPGLAAWMLDDFAGLDPNGLDMPLLTFEEGVVEVFDRRRRRRGGRGRVH